MTAQAETVTSRPQRTPGALGTVLVTGGASGLGAAIAQAVGDAGGRPMVLDRQAASGSGEAEHFQVDLSDTAAAERAVAEVGERAGGIDAVVTAAGIDVPGALDSVSGADWEYVIKTNLLGTAAVVRAALPQLRQRRGKLVTVASTLGMRGFPDATAYCASKFGIVGFTRALAAETAGEVGVTLLLPGGMATSFFEGRPDQYKPGPDAQLNPPAEVAEAVLFALTRPAGSEVREMVCCPSTEPSWP